MKTNQEIALDIANAVIALGSGATKSDLVAAITAALPGQFCHLSYRRRAYMEAMQAYIASGRCLDQVESAQIEAIHRLCRLHADKAVESEMG